MFHDQVWLGVIMAKYVSFMAAYSISYVAYLLLDIE